MLSAALKIFFPTKRQVTAPKKEKVHHTSIMDIPRYPPFDKGLPLVTPSDILQTQQEIIHRIEKTIGMTPADFKERVQPVIENLARYVHLLPATSNHHHRGAGGLFRLALETGLYSLQQANATVFINRGVVAPEIRYKLNPKWAYAAFLAGVCSDLYRPLTSMVVVDDQGGKWPQLLMPLYDWADRNEKERYFILWNVQDEVSKVNQHQASSAYLIPSIIPPHSMQWLNEDNGEIISTMTACITGGGAVNQISAIVSKIRLRIIDRDLKRNQEMYGDYIVGAHLEPHLIDAMRRLVRAGTWTINCKGARVWHTKEGMFVIWKAAAREMLQILSDDKLPGIPRDADTLADIMISSGIAEENSDDGNYWELIEPVNMSTHSAIKVANSEVLFPDGMLHEVSSTPVLLKNMKKVKHGKGNELTGPVQEELTLLQQKFDESKRSLVAIDESVHANHNQEDPITPVSMSREKAIPTPDEEEAGKQHASATDPAETMVQKEIAEGKTASAANQINKNATAKLQSEDTPSERMAQSLLASLPAADSQLIQLILEDHTTQSSAHPIFSHECGIAISTKEAEEHGNSNIYGFIKTLNDKGWLWRDMGAPLQKVHDLEYVNAEGDQQTVTCFVIREEIAKGLGFDWKKPKRTKK